MANPPGNDAATIADAVHPTISVRTLDSPADIESAATVLQQVWGTTKPVVGVELLRAMSHAGGYVAGAFERGHMVGASFGFLGFHNGESALHSHITGILAGVRSVGGGRVMKMHQREWAADHGVEWITWTFDPLVRRNAWFNIEVLGATVSEYMVNFYGELDDAINRNDESDRLMMAWPVDADRPVDPVPDSWPTVLVPTPDHIVNIRRTDAAEAERWRLTVRVELGERIENGAVVTGFTRDGEYVLRVPE